MDFNNIWVEYQIAIITITIIWYLVTISFIVWSYQKKGLSELLLVMFLSLLGVLIVFSLPADQKFRCGICFKRHHNKSLGGEAFRKEKVKVCCYCLEKEESKEAKI